MCIRDSVYTGEAGSGLTHRLHSHAPQCENLRVVRVDCQALTHRSLLIEILSLCSAACPPRAKISELREMAAIAIGAAPTLLMIDNLHYASAKTHASIQHVISYSAETAATFATPVVSAPKIAAFEWYIARGQREEVETLTKGEARQLALSHLAESVPDENRDAAARRIVTVSQGHAKTVIAAARRVESGELDELRTMEGRKSAEWSFLWLLIAFVLVVVMLNAQRYTAAAALAVATVAMLIGRRLLTRSLGTVLPRR